MKTDIRLIKALMFAHLKPLVSDAENVQIKRYAERGMKNLFIFSYILKQSEMIFTYFYDKNE
jgi:hypothetical protein